MMNESQIQYVKMELSFIDGLVKSLPMAMEKGPEARHSVWPGVKAYI
jgi:hypothetical protein